LMKFVFKELYNYNNIKLNIIISKNVIILME